MLCAMCWSCCLVDVISFGTIAPEALQRLEEVLERLSAFGLELKPNKYTFMQTDVAFPRRIVGRTGLACDPGKISAVLYMASCFKLEASQCPFYIKKTLMISFTR